MKNTNCNTKQIEEWATLAVKDCLSMTDTLSQFIKENDKTPSWDGDVIIYKGKSINKEDIVGKVTVQVKGEMVKNINREEYSFSVDMADLVNYKNNGGTIYFVVLIDKKSPKRRRVFFEALTPLKIENYIKGHINQKSRVIKLKKLPKDKYSIQTIFFNFYQDSNKQHSFSSISPIGLRELSLRKDIVEITSSLKIFSPDKNLVPIQEFLRNDVYWYAKIANSPILHPIEWFSEVTVIAKNGFPPVIVKGERYDNYVIKKITKDDVTLQFGESTTLVFSEKSRVARLNFNLSGLLRSKIKDLNFIINVTETGVIVFGENKKLNLGQLFPDVPFDIVSAKKELAYYRRVEQFWKSLHVFDNFDIEKIDSNSSIEELNLLMKSINGKYPIRANVDGEHSGYFLRKNISNFKILFFLDVFDKEKSLYKIYNLFDYPGFFKIVRGNNEHITSQYSALTADDYLELSNIDLTKMLQSYKDLIYLSDNIFEPANFDLLNILLAYDKQNDPPIALLNTAKEIAKWILNESAEKLQEEFKILNYLQVIKRERELTEEENLKLYEIAENKSNNIMTQLGANLLLENYKVARIQFEHLDKNDKEVFRSYPIYKFWK